jgi:hypothetical protein
MNAKSIIVSAATLMLMAGCAAKAIHPNAQQVRILDKAPESKCKYIGEAIGSQGNFFTGAYTTDENLQRGALNELKNKAANMGGNAIVLVSNQAGLTQGSQRNMTSLGNVYSCEF